MCKTVYGPMSEAEAEEDSNSTLESETWQFGNPHRCRQTSSRSNATFTVMAPDGPQPRTTDQIFKGHKVVLFGVAGAFTPVCDKHHLPGFLDNLDRFKAQGVDEIAVTGVNDVFVMDPWAKSAGH